MSCVLYIYSYFFVCIYCKDYCHRVTTQFQHVVIIIMYQLRSQATYSWILILNFVFKSCQEITIFFKSWQKCVCVCVCVQTRAHAHTHTPTHTYTHIARSYKQNAWCYSVISFVPDERPPPALLKRLSPVTDSTLILQLPFAMTQALSCRPRTAWARVRSRVSPCQM